MGNGRKLDVLHPVTEDLFHLAPIPLIYHQLQDPGVEAWHAKLIEDAQRAFSGPILEVPDVRHIDDLGKPIHFDAPSWSEEHDPPAVGVWHSVPTNGYLKVETSSVQALKKFIEDRYLNALKLLGFGTGHVPLMSESWIQFYKTSDYKVLHNHERYAPPYPTHPWAGAYYIDNGAPDPNIPYSGILSFRIRQTNYFIRPLPGLLVMWPSDILHEVHPFYGTRERVVVNFNIQVKNEKEA